MKPINFFLLIYANLLNALCCGRPCTYFFCFSDTFFISFNTDNIRRWCLIAVGNVDHHFSLLFELVHYKYKKNIWNWLYLWNKFFWDTGILCYKISRYDVEKKLPLKMSKISCVFHTNENRYSIIQLIISFSCTFANLRGL